MWCRYKRIMWAFLGHTTKLLLGAFGHPHNKRQQIVHTEKSTDKKEEQDYLKNPIHQRSDSGAVSEIQWAFLGVVSEFPGFEYLGR